MALTSRRDTAITGRLTELQRGDLVFDVHDSGPSDGDVAVLLHGWPTDSRCWAAVAPLLADRGMRTVAMDQRGYSPRARPGGRRPYRMSELVADVVALLDELPSSSIHLVGHDWGGAVAWALAAAHPERLATLTVLSTPHPRAMARALVSSPQALRSAYIGFFQLPVLPERVLLARGGALLLRLLVGSGLAPEVATRHVEELREPGALTASLAWYRAIPLGSPDVGPISVPTLHVWSDGDGALDRRGAELTADDVTGPYRFEVLEGVSHWIPEERPTDVVDMIVEHTLGSSEGERHGS